MTQIAKLKLWRAKAKLLVDPQAIPMSMEEIRERRTSKASVNGLCYTMITNLMLYHSFCDKGQRRGWLM
jgi:hypothetical protein